MKTWIPKLTLMTATTILLTTTASAALVAAAWDAAIAPRADVRQDQTENDNGIRGMNEAQTVTFAGTPNFGVTLANQIVVDCHLAHFDPVNDPKTVTGRFRFDGEIIGVITDSDTLDDFDPLCNRAPMVYPAPGAEPYRGLEPASTPSDSVTVFQGPGGAWNQIEITAEVTAHSDQVRIITCRDAAIPCSDIADSIGWDQLQMP